MKKNQLLTVCFQVSHVIQGKTECCQRKSLYEELPLEMLLFFLQVKTNNCPYHFEKTKKNLLTRVDAKAFG